jgi:hypothetical protein
MTSPKPRSPKKDFSQEWKGAHCGIHTPATYVARTQQEWEKLWNTTHSNSFPAPTTPKLPKGKMAIGIFTGQSSSSRDISVTGIDDTNGTTTVHWNAQAAKGGGGMMTTVMHEPFLLKFIDKTDSNITFSRDTGPSCEIAPPAINLKNLRNKFQPPQ